MSGFQRLNRCQDLPYAIQRCFQQCNLKTTSTWNQLPRSYLPTSFVGISPPFLHHALKFMSERIHTIHLLQQAFSEIQYTLAISEPFPMCNVISIKFPSLSPDKVWETISTLPQITEMCGQATETNRKATPKPKLDIPLDLGEACGLQVGLKAARHDLESPKLPFQCFICVLRKSVKHLHFYQRLCHGSLRYVHWRVSAGHGKGPGKEINHEQ